MERTADGFLLDGTEYKWSELPFGYIPTNCSYVCNYKDGQWGEGYLTTDHTVQLSECAGILHYCQEVFEGLKAYTTENGDVVTFRPDLNADRMFHSAERLVMPPFPKDRFVEAVKEVVQANLDWVPPYGTGASLYIRPFMFATGEVIGVKPADEYQFRILVTPVGPYFKGGAKPIKLCVSDYDRAANNGTGHVKAGLNYAMSLYPYVLAHHEGFDENVYLDSIKGKYIEETGGANILFVDEAGNLVIPMSFTNSILPSITRRSLVVVAEDILGIPVIERPVELAEVDDFVECGLCGTAAVISPVHSITTKGPMYVFNGGKDESGPVMAKLRQTLVDIQAGKIEGPEGWVVKIADADSIPW